MHISVIKLTKHGLLELGKSALYANKNQDVILKHRCAILNSSMKSMNILIISRIEGIGSHIVTFKSSKQEYIYIHSYIRGEWHSKLFINETKNDYPSIYSQDSTIETPSDKIFNWECLVIAEPDRAKAIYDKLKGDPRDYTPEELEDVCESLSLLDTSHYLTMDNHIRR